MTDREERSDSQERFQRLSEQQRIIASALKEYFRERAKIWWRHDERDEVICDTDERPIPRGEGYLIAPSHIDCEVCMDRKSLTADWDEASEDLDNYFGPNLPRHIIHLSRNKQL